MAATRTLDCPPVLLRIPDLRSHFGLTRSKVYALIKRDPSFPAPVSIGERAVAFRYRDLCRWADGLPPARCASHRDAA